MLLAADVVDKQLEAYLHRNGIPQTFGAQERIHGLHHASAANAAPMIESLGKRNAGDRFHGDLTGSPASARPKYPPTIKRRWNATLVDCARSPGPH